MNRVQICGEITQRHEQIIELTDEQLEKLRNELSKIKNEKDEVLMDNFLGENFGDTHPVDREYNQWTADLIDDDGVVMDNLGWM